MAWLRIDDGFAFHPKIGLLTRSERWTWVELLCHCATQRTGGEIPPNIVTLYRFVTPKFLSKVESIGLVDRDEDGRLHVHDWKDYNDAQTRAAARQKRYRERSASVTRDVTRDVTDDVTRDVTRDARPPRARVPHPQEQNPSFLPSEAKDAGGRAGRRNEIDEQRVGIEAARLLDHLREGSETQ